MISLTTGRQMQVGYVIAFFDGQDRSLRLRCLRPTAENLCPSTTMVRVHDGALVDHQWEDEYAASYYQRWW